MSKGTAEIIHVSDLHLSEKEKEYSLSVLYEIIHKYASADCILFSGDVFDSYRDALHLRSEFRKITESFSGEMIYIPGNHEELEKSKNDSLLSLDFGKIIVSGRLPCDLKIIKLQDEDVEFLTIPHQPDCSNYRFWNIPQKKSRYRIALAHGNVSDLLEYTGPGDEAGAEMLDAELFGFHGCDYAALGHIHSHRSENVNGTVLAYAGSARVWRKGESGEHGIYRIKLGKSLSYEFLPLESAGTYRKIILPVQFECETTPLPDEIFACGGCDRVDIELQGLVENENKIAVLEDKIKDALKKNVRSLDVIRSEVTPFPGISEIPIVKQFLKEWEAQKENSNESAELWHRVRQIALLEIKDVLEKQS